MDNKEYYFETVATVIEALPNATFRVKTNENKIVLAYISGKIRKNYIKIIIGDLVVVQMSFYDLSRGRIIFRKKEA